MGIDESWCWRTTIKIPMRDGVVLVADRYAADVSLSKPTPVVLERTPYGRRVARASERFPGIDRPLTPVEVAVHLANHQFVVIMQDCRGRGESEGGFTKYLGEGQDGFDTVEWLGSQAWCDGRVFTMGLSYGAHAQAALASLGPRFLAGMFMDCGGFASAYEAGCRQGGAFEMKQVTWAIRHAAKSPEASAAGGEEALVESVDVPSWLNLWPWQRGKSPISYAPSYENYLLEQYRETSFSPYWRQVGLYARGYYSQFPDVPTLHMSGWYDPYTMTAIDNFRALSEGKASRSYLVLGPWTHGARSLSYAGEVEFGEDATLEGHLAPNFLEFRDRWFSEQAGRSTVPALTEAVTFFLMGGGDGHLAETGRVYHGGRWLTSSVWPPEGVGDEAWFLCPGGLLDQRLPSGVDDFVEYDHDPRVPVPTVGGSITSGEPVMRGGAFDQRWSFMGSNGEPQSVPLELRDDVVCFDSEPLAEDLAVVGRPKLKLMVSSSALDTDFCWKLIDVYPPSLTHPQGFAMNITDAILRCRYRNGFEEPEPMQPGATYSVEIVAPDTANLFSRGHRIRVVISSSNFPRFDLNRNIWPDDGRRKGTNVARNRIHLGGITPSHLELPVWTS